MDKKLANNAIFNIIYKLLNVLFPLITSAYVSRVLLADGVGKVEYARNFATIFVFIAALGIPAYGTKIIASLKNEKNQSLIDKAFSELLIIIMCSSLICVIIYSIIIRLDSKFNQDLLLFTVTGIQILLVSINIDWLYQGKEIYKYITIRSFLVKLISLACIFLLVKQKSDYIIYALIISLGVAGNNIFNILYARKFVHFTLKKINLKPHILPVIYLLLSTIAGELYSKIDILMLGHYSTGTTIGFYSNAVKTINAILTGVTAITAVYLPRLSLLVNENNEKFKKLVNEGVELIGFISIPVMIGMIVVSDIFVNTMFGEAFSKTSLTVQILSPLIVIKGIGDLINYQVIISIDKEKYFIVTTSIAAIINIALNSFLIPKYLQNGAAIASVVSELIVNVGMLFVSSKIVSLKIDLRYWISLLVSSLLMAVIVFVFTNMIATQNIIKVIISVLLGGIIYLLSNVIIKNKILYCQHRFQFDRKRR